MWDFPDVLRTNWQRKGRKEHTMAHWWNQVKPLQLHMLEQCREYYVTHHQHAAGCTLNEIAKCIMLLGRFQEPSLLFLVRPSSSGALSKLL